MRWLAGYAYSTLFLGWNSQRARLYADLCRDGYVQSIHGFNRRMQ